MGRSEKEKERWRRIRRSKGREGKGGVKEKRRDREE